LALNGGVARGGLRVLPGPLCSFVLVAFACLRRRIAPAALHCGGDLGGDLVGFALGWVIDRPDQQLALNRTYEGDRCTVPRGLLEPEQAISGR
jgi:hypothetical protein